MVILQMVDTPPWTHPLTCPSSEETEKEYEVNTSCFLTDRQGRTHTSSSPSPPPASSLLEVCFTSLTPTFSSQSPSLVGWYFQPSIQQKTQKEAGPLSLFPPLQRGGKGDRRTADHPYQCFTDQSQQKACASEILIPNMQKKHADNKLPSVWSVHPNFACAGINRHGTDQTPAYFNYN